MTDRQIGAATVPSAKPDGQIYLSVSVPIHTSRQAVLTEKELKQELQPP